MNLPRDNLMRGSVCSYAGTVCVSAFKEQAAKAYSEFCVKAGFDKQIAT